MGIGNRVLDRVELYPRSHYPSWGSGTSAWRGRCPPISLPHYPSWGSGTSCTERGHRSLQEESHYPSWGSGTQKDRRPRNVHVRLVAHYPSWGSGTDVSSAMSTSTSRVSLPLMGIGNRCPGRPRSTGSRRLITPHGDREPISATPPGRRHVGSHYPSWGSGTWGTPAGNRILGVHYPSWGSVQGSLLIVDAHYPSWGSGTGSPLSAAVRK